MKNIKIFFLNFIFLMLVGCEAAKSITGIKQSKVWLEKIHIRSLAYANDDSPIKISVAVVYTDDLMKVLNTMDSATYFKKINNLKNDAGKNLELFETTIIPQSAKILEIKPSSSDGACAILFARYNSKGNHRQNVSDNYEIELLLDKKDFKITTIVSG